MSFHIALLYRITFCTCRIIYSIKRAKRKLKGEKKVDCVDCHNKKSVEKSNKRVCINLDIFYLMLFKF